MLDLQDCAHCGKSFLPKRKWAKYCSQFCNQAAYYARKAPPSVDDLAPQSGPTSVQEAEFQRRKAMSPEPHEDKKILDEALKLLGDKDRPPSPLDDWLDSSRPRSEKKL